MSGRPAWARPGVAMAAILLLAAVVRLTHIQWDQNHFFHPDERAITSAVMRLSFSPLQLDPEFFAYGSLPIYLAKIATSLTSFVDPNAASYDGIIITGRRLSAVLGTLTVLLTMLLGTRLYDRSVGLLAGFLMAVCALHVQNSRFATVDVPLTFFVLLALLQLVRLARDGRRGQYLAAGACIGLAVATKFSAMPLFGALGVAALVRWRSEGQFFRVAGWTVLAVLSGVVAFAVAEPYVVLRFDRVFRDIFEQSQMVRNAGLFPFTTQYIGTPKYAYELTQLVLWCMAPPLGLAAVWATVARPAHAWRNARVEEWVLLSWVVPFFLVTGWFEVKFPRYLLPIYPVMIVWASEWLLRRYRQGAWIGRLGLPVVVAGTAMATLAFTSLYTRPHTVVTASEWVYRHVPEGSKILSQDWDEGFPMPLPGARPQNYTIVNFGYYERPDSTAKIRRLAGELASTDYIAFQTKRLYGALTQAPDRFPLSNNYFYRLFAGDLGFELVHEVTSRPSLFGLEAPTELADESISVYDHPKVLIFKNTGRLAEDEIFDRIVNGLPSRPMTRSDLLLASPAASGSWSATGAAPAVRSGPVAFAYFVVLVELLGLAAFALLRSWLPGVGTYALAKVLGVLFFAYGAWLVVSLGFAGFTQTTLAGLVALLVALGWLRRRRGIDWPPRAELVATEMLVWGSFVFFVAVRLYNPEIYWGEKPMDFSILNALHRTTTLPPPEPWFAGSPLYYSYFGYFVVAALGKALHVHPALNYNLGVALVGSLATAAVFAAGSALTQRWRVGLLAAFFATLIGNLSGPLEAWSRQTIDFHYYWATSRVIRDTINEYPFWSFLFADLHAHMMVMPFTMAFVTLLVLWTRAAVLRLDGLGAGRAVVLTLLLALCLGTIIVTNAWSTPTYALLLPFVLGTVWIVERPGRGVLRFFGGLLGRVALPTVLVAAGAYVLYLPFWANFVPPERNFNWEPDHRVLPGDFFEVFGLYLYILVPCVLMLWTRQLRGSRVVRGVLLTLVLLVLAAGPILGPVHDFGPGWIPDLGGSTRATLIALFLLTLSTLLAPHTPTQWRIPLALTAFAFAVTAGTDVVYVWDRMNTIFKFYLESWFLMSIAAAAMVRALWRGGWLHQLWRVGLVLLIGIGVFTAVTGTYGVIHTDRVPTPEPSLDGMAYLEQRSPHEYAAFAWLNENIRGIPVLLEAHGDSYQEFTRVSMNTGLPTVLGWAYHVFQRAQTWPDINRRKADIETAYTSDDKEVVGAILERYHVGLVYVGALERRTYAGGNLERFKQWSDLLTLVYENEGVHIFAVNGRFQGTLPVTTIEAIPQIAGEQPGRSQDAPGRLQQPRGVAVAPDGHVFVADFGNHRIQKFAADGGFVAKWGREGELPSQFREPCAIAVGPDGSVYVADTWNHRVQKFSATGEYQVEWSASFYGPRGVTVDAQGQVYVADTGNNQIIRFTPEGRETRRWGGKGDGPGLFLEPMGLGTDAQGRVYVCDNGNGRLQIFSPDGVFVRSFPVEGWRSEVFSEPEVDVDAKGRIWVSVPSAKEIRAYDENGTVLHTITARTFPDIFFATPIGVDVDPTRDELVVTDLDGRMVRVPLP